MRFGFWMRAKTWELDILHRPGNGLQAVFTGRRFTPHSCKMYREVLDTRVA